MMLRLFGRETWVRNKTKKCCGILLNDKLGYLIQMNNRQGCPRTHGRNLESAKESLMFDSLVFEVYGIGKF